MSASVSSGDPKNRETDKVSKTKSVEENRYARNKLRNDFLVSSKVNEKENSDSDSNKIWTLPLNPSKKVD